MDEISYDELVELCRIEPACIIPSKQELYINIAQTPEHIRRYYEESGKRELAHKLLTKING